MTHSIISTIVIGLVLALAFGVVAHRLRLPPLIGYLLAGVAIGPFTPGYVADTSIANELAEIGVILLMFGVGLHFSLEDLLSVRGIAVSGAAAQVFLAIPLALALGWWQGWTPAAGVIFGIALSVASTVVVLRLLQDEQMSGPFNMTAPNPVTNAELTRVLARTLHRPALFIAPGFMLRLAMGERAALLLEGQRALPANLTDAGYEFKYPTLSSALAALLKR